MCRLLKTLKAGAMRGSTQDLKRLVTFVGKSSQPHVELLQVFYRHLQPKKIPHLIPTTSKTARPLELALMSLQGISSWAQVHLLKDKSYVVGLEGSWPDIWKWVHFFLARCIEEIKKLTAFSTPFVCHSYTTCIILLDLLANDADLRLTIAMTPEVIQTLTNLWILEAKSQQGFPGYASSIALVNFLTPLPEYTNCIASFREACGEGPTELAATCLRRVTANHKGPTPDLHALDADIRVIVSLSGRRLDADEFRMGLLEQQSLAIISRIMYRLASGAKPTPSPIMFSCLTFCVAYLHDHEDATSDMILEALESNLIPALLLSGRWLLPGSTSTMLRDIRCEMVADILPRYFVYRSVLLEANRSLKWIRTRNLETQDTMKEQFGDAWVKLEGFVQSHLMIDAHSPLYMVCENTAVSLQYMHNRQLTYASSQCNIVKERKEFMRCSGCRESYFCSRECLKRMWKYGNHHSKCKIVKAQRRGIFSSYQDDVKIDRFTISAGIKEPISTSDANFLARILRHDWRKDRNRIQILQDEQLKGRPAIKRGSLFTTFNYEVFPPFIAVNNNLAHLPRDYHNNEAIRLQFDESVTRASSSDGRLALVCAYIKGIHEPAVFTIVVPGHDED